MQMAQGKEVEDAKAFFRNVCNQLTELYLECKSEVSKNNKVCTSTLRQLYDARTSRINVYKDILKSTGYQTFNYLEFKEKSPPGALIGVYAGIQNLWNLLTIEDSVWNDFLNLNDRIAVGAAKDVQEVREQVFDMLKEAKQTVFELTPEVSSIPEAQDWSEHKCELSA